MNDLKQGMLEMAQYQNFTPSKPIENMLPVYNPETSIAPYNSNINNNMPAGNSAPILLPHNDHHEDIEETLMLTDREKEFITKALKKTQRSQKGCCK